MNTARVPALVGLCVLAGCRAPAEPALSSEAVPTPTAIRADAARGVDPLALERALAARVSEARAQERVRELAALGPRLGASPSSARAAALYTAWFEQAGLAASVFEEEQRWGWDPLAWELELLVPDAPPARLASAFPYGGSPAGAGEVALALEPLAGSARIVERLSRARRDDPLPDVVLNDGDCTLDGRWPVLRVLWDGPPAAGEQRAPVFGLSEADGALVRAALARHATGVRLRWRLDALFQQDRPRTAIGVLAARADASRAQRDGGAAPARYFLVTAHADSDAGGPGANDNASGAAIVLEIASAWAAAIRDGLVSAPPCEVRFALLATEIRSSRALLADAEARGDTIVGVLNFDQAGFGSGADRLYVEPDDVAANESFVRTLIAVLEQHAGQQGFPREWATNGSQGGTDSYVFAKSEAFRSGLRPAVLLYTSAWGAPREVERTSGMPGEAWRERDLVAIDHDLHYHSAGDTPANTTEREPWNMGWCARVGLLATRRWLERSPP